MKKQQNELYQIEKSNFIPKHRNNEDIEQKKIIIQINKKMCGGKLRNSSTSIVTMTIN